MTKRKTKKKVQWEYCECGCKGYYVSFGEYLHFWLYWDLDTRWELKRGHGMYAFNLGVYKSKEEADVKVFEIAEEEFVAFKKALGKR